MPLPPQPTPPGPLPIVAAPNTPGQSATNPAVLLGKLKQLQETLNEVQQQLSELVDDVTKSSGLTKP